jgi:adenosylmethionine-8-amino-7-oxononanoate aminotransferase
LPVGRAFLRRGVLSRKNVSPLRGREATGGGFVGAVIEPLIQGAAGMIAHPIGYLEKFAALCRQHDVPLIADEVMTGFGRTGTMFACEQEKSVAPDFLCLAKGLTGGYLPLAATLTSRRVFDAFLGDHAERKAFFHGHSYTANPLGCAAALGNLEVFEREKTLRTVVARSVELGVMLQRFWGLQHVGDVRQVGLIAGIELVRDWKSREPYPWEHRVGARVCEEAKRNGVLTRPIGNVLVIMPPYCATPDQLEKICHVLENSIRTVCG